ncbi:hypothetical protein [Clostridium sp.]|uniref:hypothetical protein n=1 Tax=Clostridium sp. TaxID=1506 RepID=UPI00321791E9
MKQFLKKHIRLVTVIGVLFIIYMGYLTSKESVNVDEELDKAISNYSLGNFDAGYKQFEAHKIYGIEEKDNVINVYMYSLCRGYSLGNKKFYARGQYSHPVFMTLKKNDGKYSVVEYKEAEYGINYEESVMEIFPTKYAKKALYDTKYSAGLSGNIRKQAKKWLKEEGKSRFVLE